MPGKHGAQFTRFIVAGGIAAAANFLSRIALSTVLTYSVAIVVAYAVGMATAYLLMKYFVFEAGRWSVAGEVAMFCAVNALALAQTLLVSLVLAYALLPWLGITRYREEIAHFVGVCVPIFTSFIGHKYGTFRAHTP